MPLADHRMRQEQWARSNHQRAMLPEVYGDFITKLAQWDWWVTITFRDLLPRDLAVARIEEWLADIQRAVGGKQIGWVLAEEFGRLGGRFHCHLLVTGVRTQRRTFWWSEAFRRFGRTDIAPFNPEKAAAYYAAKYAAKQLGYIHFGGTLAGTNLHQFVSLPNQHRYWNDLSTSSSDPVSTHSIVAPSVALERGYFTFNQGRMRTRIQNRGLRPQPQSADPVQKRWRVHATRVKGGGCGVCERQVQQFFGRREAPPETLRCLACSAQWNFLIQSEPRKKNEQTRPEPKNQLF